MLRKLSICAAVAAALFISPSAFAGTATAIKAMVITTAMVTAIIITVTSKMIGTTASIGTLPSAVAGGAVVGGATAKVPAGDGPQVATSGFAAK